MRIRQKVTLPSGLKRRGEIVGLVCGALCFPIAFIGKVNPFADTGPSAVVLPIVLLSTVAGVVACLLNRRDFDEALLGFAPRVGVRAGLVAALVAGASTVIAATLHAFGIGRTDQNDFGNWLLAEMLPGFRPAAVLFIALLAIPPSIFFGMAGALITAMLQTPPPTMRLRWLSIPRDVFFTVVVLFAIGGYLSPFSLLLRPKPKPIVEVPPIPAPPPKWRYEKPTGFDDAGANQLIIATHRVFTDLAYGTPVALAPNDRFFAFQIQSGDLVVLELDTMDEMFRRRLPNTAAGIAWSPDSQRLCVVIESGERAVLIAEISSGDLIALPQPKNDYLPQGEPIWWDGTEIVFRLSDQSFRALDLDKLWVHPIEESSKWKRLTQSERQKILNAPEPELPKTSKWQLTLRSAVRDYKVPPEADASPWRVEQSFHVAFDDVQRPHRNVQMPITVNEGDGLITTADRTKLIRLHGAWLEVYFFGVRDSPRLSFEVQMPGPPDITTTEMLKKGAVCAFVCTPVINPLNRKTVGPSRGEVKALARLASWTGTRARFWIEEGCYPISPSDVVADLHVWNGAQATAIKPHHLFATIGDAIDQDVIPSLDIVAPADNRASAQLKARLGAFYVDEVRAVEPKEPPPKLLPEAPPAAAPTVGPPTAQGEQGLNEELIESLTGFIILHHSKSSRGDVAGLIDDYAPQVDHFDNGIVSRERIRKDELEYHAPGVSVQEGLTGLPKIERITDDLYKASYTISFRRTQPDGRWVKGFADVTLHIAMTDGVPKIVLQRAMQRNREKGP